MLISPKVQVLVTKCMLMNVLLINTSFEGASRIPKTSKVELFKTLNDCFSCKPTSKSILI